MQLAFGLVILRSSWGTVAIGWTGDRVSDFLRHADAGSMFVFGKKYTDHFFAFKVRERRERSAKSALFF